MEQIISKEELDELNKIKGEIRGVGMKTHSRFILKEEGEGSLEKIEEALADLGVSFKYRNVRIMDFYPLSLYCTVQLVIKRLFNYDDEKFKEMGEFNSRFSLIIRLFMKHFVSVKAMIKQTPNVWRKYFTVGSIKITEYNEKEKYMILRVEDFHITPILCQIIRGFFPGVAQMVVGNKGTCEEIKCSFKGAPYEEFLFKW